MQDFPHHYRVSATATGDEAVIVKGENLPQIVTAAPAEFGGPGDRWSPESLLVAAVADCFVLSFRAIATASKFDWKSIACNAEGVLDRVERTMTFTEVHINVVLHISGDTSADKAERLLHKAEETCLITNSLSASTHLTTEIVIDA